MADVTIPGLTLLTSIDRAADLFEVSDTSDSGNSRKTTVNNMLNLTSAPVGINDTQTLTLKTITAPTISSPVLSGTVTGTYTLGGTPTFPSTVVTLTDSQTLTNKVLTAPTITTATISNPTLTVDTISEFTAANGVTVDGLNIKDNKLNTNNSVVTNNITDLAVTTAKINDSAVTSAKVATGIVVQVVSTNYNAASTTTTLIPLDDTIPQITEGGEFMTQSITPKSATNVLVIEATIFCSHSVAGSLTSAIFQDSTANALAADCAYQAVGTGPVSVKVAHTMTAGTTSSTTFRVRAGSDSAGTLTFNGTAGTRKFGGITLSSIKITEYKA